MNARGIRAALFVPALYVLAPCVLGLGAPATDARGQEVRLEQAGVDGSNLVVKVMAADLDEVGSFDVTVRFDPHRLAPPSRSEGVLGENGMAADNGRLPGQYRLALIVPAGVSGGGEIATLRFPIQGEASGVELGLEARLTDLRGAGLPTKVEGLYIASLAPEYQDPELEAEQEAQAELETETPSELDSATDDGKLNGRETDEGVRDEPSDADLRNLAGDSDDRAATQVATRQSETSDPTASDESGRSTLDAERPGSKPMNEAWKVEDRNARSEGYQLNYVFEPEGLFAATGTTPIGLTVRVFKLGFPQPLAERDVRLSGTGVTVRKVRISSEGALGGGMLHAELGIDPGALPVRLEIHAFGLHEEHLVPVYPRVDADLDHSGRIDMYDYEIMSAAYGSRPGNLHWEERCDLVRDGIVDEADLWTFQFNMVENERARRLKRLERLESKQQEE